MKEPNPKTTCSTCGGSGRHCPNGCVDGPCPSCSPQREDSAPLNASITHHEAGLHGICDESQPCKPTPPAKEEGKCERCGGPRVVTNRADGYKRMADSVGFCQCSSPTPETSWEQEFGKRFPYDEDLVESYNFHREVRNFNKGTSVLHPARKELKRFIRLAVERARQQGRVEQWERDKEAVKNVDPYARGYILVKQSFIDALSLTAPVEPKPDSDKAG